MFEQYSQLIEESKIKELEIIKKYDSLKEELSLNFKRDIANELQKIEKILLKEYSPVQYYNSLTVIVNKHNNLEKEKEKEIKENKENLDKELSKLLECKEKTKVTEMYKIISTASDNNAYICRVWFTLIPIEKYNCIPGDPIRIEWVHVITQRVNDNDRSVVVERNGPGLTGLNMPHFNVAGKVTHVNQTYNVNNWGENSQQKTWWKEWLKQNRPC